MAIGADEIKSISGGSQKGVAALDEFNPTKLGIGAATPQGTGTALTAKDTSVVDGTYGAEEALVVANNRTRIEEIEALLIANGIVAAP
jgi:hypothetical protein